MKTLKIIGIVILVLILIIIVLGLVAPKSYHAERTIMIDAPKEIVFEHVKYWKNWKDWSPWAEMDPSMEVKVEGTDGTVGATYKWIGDPKLTGNGQMQSTGLKENEEIAYHLSFVEPWESESDGYLRLIEEEGQTKAAWGFFGENPFPWNILMLFMSMEDMVAKDFDRGLTLLKEISEKDAAIILKYEIKPVDFSAKNYASIQKVVPFNDMKTFFETSYQTIQKAMKKKWKKMKGAPAGLYYFWDEINMSTDVAAAIPIRGSINMGDVKTIILPKTQAYVVEYLGPYEQLIYAHKALGYYFAKNNLKMKWPVIEEYITDPMTEPDNSKWQTNIYYFSE